MRLQLGWTLAAALMLPACTGDLFHDTTWADGLAGGGTCAACQADAVFVRNEGDDAAAGTASAPVKTLARAIDLAATSGKAVFACAQTFEEAIVVPGGLGIVGGRDCASGSWATGDAKTIVAAPAGAVAVRLDPTSAGQRTELSRVHVLAADAAEPGASSIAVLADGATASFSACVLEAGNGAPGDNGEQPPATALGGADGNAGVVACTNADPVPGGASVSNACPTGTSTSGKGGDAHPGANDAGDPGLPGPANGGAIDGLGVCDDGGNGAEGAPGSDGLAGMGAGTIDSSGYQGVAGQTGGAGAPGQGGGGGGASRPGSNCSTLAGASGGSGGAGGCGGAGGSGGRPGGSSIAVVSLQSELTFGSTKLVAHDGGRGGDGGAGQFGGSGGAFGDGGASVGQSLAGCRGGFGGQGGNGGKGGGGQGGHSLGIAFVGPGPMQVQGAGAEFVLGSAGAPGEGGMPQASAGVDADTLEF